MTPARAFALASPSATWLGRRSARSGDPSGGLKPAWPKLSEGGSHIVFDRTVTVAKDLDAAPCKFWDDLGLTPK